MTERIRRFKLPDDTHHEAARGRMERKRGKR
jgi:hypothetical protein